MATDQNNWLDYEPDSVQFYSSIEPFLQTSGDSLSLQQNLSFYDLLKCAQEF